jgi:hypothetical protein
LQDNNKRCTKIRVNHSQASSTLSPAALGEFTKVSRADWQGDVPLVELLARINRVAVLLVGGDDHKQSTTGRVKRIFTERSFRHYQTLGCIEVPDKTGRLAHYGLRHFLQALLVRKLLWERVSAEQISRMLIGRDTDELERMLLGGVELVARAGRGGDEVEPPGPDTSVAELWNRVRVAPGLELHMSTERSCYEPEEFRRVIEKLKKLLRGQGS